MDERVRMNCVQKEERKRSEKEKKAMELDPYVSYVVHLRSRQWVISTNSTFWIRAIASPFVHLIYSRSQFRPRACVTVDSTEISNCILDKLHIYSR